MANACYTECELHDMKVRKGTILICKKYGFSRTDKGFKFQFVDGTYATWVRHQQSILEVIKTNTFGFIAKDLNTGEIVFDVTGGFSLM